MRCLTSDNWRYLTSESDASIPNGALDEGKGITVEQRCHCAVGAQPGNPSAHAGIYSTKSSEGRRRSAAGELLDGDIWRGRSPCARRSRCSRRWASWRYATATGSTRAGGQFRPSAGIAQLSDALSAADVRRTVPHSRLAGIGCHRGGHARHQRRGRGRTGGDPGGVAAGASKAASPTSRLDRAFHRVLYIATEQYVARSLP